MQISFGVPRDMYLKSIRVPWFALFRHIWGEQCWRVYVAKMHCYKHFMHKSLLRAIFLRHKLASIVLPICVEIKQTKEPG